MRSRLNAITYRSVTPYECWLVGAVPTDGQTVWWREVQAQARHDYARFGITPPGIQPTRPFGHFGILLAFWLSGDPAIHVVLCDQNPLARIPTHPL